MGLRPKREAQTWLGVEGLQPRGFFKLDLLRKVPCEIHPVGKAQYPRLCLIRAQRHWVQKPLRSQAGEALGFSPAILGSPTRRTWGQCWSVLIKKGFVTPRTTFGLEREREKKEREEAERGPGVVVCESREEGHVLTEPAFVS